MTSRIRSSLPASAAVAVLALTAAAGCSSGGPAGGATPSTSGVTPSATGPVGTIAPATGSAAACDAGVWRTGPVAVSHVVPVPPVPVVTAVRLAQHPECGYDRLVLDLNGPVPSYDIRYVGRVSTDSSGKAITLPGNQYLLITLRPAQGHTAAGTSTLSRQVQVAGYPVLQSWALAGDSEGVVRIAIGLTRKVSIRAGELAGRLYVDFRD